MSSRSFSLSARSFNLYVNWVLPAVAGVSAPADELLGEHGTEIQEVAAVLRQMLGYQPARLYRGLILGPEHSAAGILHPDSSHRFLSWTEDRDVACWFADPDSFISARAREAIPGAEGFLVEHVPGPEEILFHHAWGQRFPLPDGRLGPLATLAGMHELLDPRQIEWNLGTQQEVITVARPAPLLLLERHGHPETRSLDERLTPPFARS